MTKQPKVIKQKDKPIRPKPVHPDLERLAKSMRDSLRRCYPDPGERQIVARKIMQEVRAT